MKQILATITLLAFPLSIFAQGTSPERTVSLSGSAIYYIPSQDEDYDSGAGVEGKIEFWQTANLGFALAGGIASWDVNDVMVAAADSDVGVGVSLGGSVIQVPLGGSILFRTPVGKNLHLQLEGGVRYVVVETDIDDDVVTADSMGNFVAISNGLDIDNGVIGIVAADVQFNVSKGISLFGGAGYQFDLAKGDVTYLGEVTGDNELEAFFIRGGIAFDL